MNSIRRIAGLALLFGPLCGCAEELGPVPMPVTTVRGVVTEGILPVSGGWIEFTPVEGTTGRLRSARLGNDGTFVVDRVAVGTNQIRLVNAKVHGRPYRGVFSMSFSTIRREARPDASEPIKIDLLIEQVRFQKRFERLQAGPTRGTHL